MDDLPLVPVIYMHRMIDLLREEHVDTDQILRECGISPALMARPDTMLTGRQTHVLISKYMGLSSHIYPGVHFGKRLDLVTHGLLGFVYFWEGSFQDMITHIMAFMRVRFPLLRFELHHGDDFFSLTVSCDSRIRHLEAFYIQVMTGSLVSLGGMLTQRMAVHCRQDIFSDPKALQGMLDCEVTVTHDRNEIRYYTSGTDLQSANDRRASPMPASSHIEEHGFVVRLRSLLLENLKT